MNPSSFTPTAVIFISLLVLSISLPRDVYRDEEKFDSCAPTLCGDKKVDYPFWGHQRPDYCGLDGFKVDCVGDVLTLDINTLKYDIIHISLDPPFLFLKRADFLSNICPKPDGFVSTSLDRTPFNITSEDETAIFHYNCNTLEYLFPYNFTCPIENTNHQGYFLFPGIPGYKLDGLKCDITVKIPVLKSAIGDFKRKAIGVQEVVNRGFEVNWLTDLEQCIECNRTGGRCGYNRSTNSFSCFCPVDLTSCKSYIPQAPGSREIQAPPKSGSRNVKLKIIIGVSAGVGGALLVCLIGHIVYRRRKQNIFAPMSWMSKSITTSYASSKSKLDIEIGEFKGVHLFSYDELEEATNHFAPENELGDGGFGTVYKGKLRDKRVVAVKRLYENNYKRVEQFMNEVEILTGLRHPNLVSLYGCTSRHSRELLLVYEYISNGTVADHLHGDRKKNGGLPWSIRMKIAVETATALTYLHTSEIIHRDIKTNNILLDNNFVVKVADFGLSRLFPTDVTHVSTAPQGTPGYVDPEYHECYQLTVKSDVYSFGVVLVELISSLPAVDITRHRHEINLSNMAINKIQSDALHELVDKNLGYESDYKVRKMINAVAELAFQCLQSAKEMRPSMGDVLENLKQIQGREYNMHKAEDLELQSDHIGLLNNGQIPPSPDTVTTQWSSSSYSTRSNTSG